MTKSFLTLKEYLPLGASKGDLLLQSEESAKKYNMDKLIEDGFFREVSESESLTIYQQQNNDQLQHNN
jgi:hypothetical protein